MKTVSGIRTKAGAGAAILLSLAALWGCSNKSPDDHLLAARQFEQAQQYDAAVIEYKNAIQLEPQAAGPRFELGRLYLHQQQYEAAEKELNRALEQGYSPSQVIPLLSVAYQQTGADTALLGIDHKVTGMTAVQSAEVGFYKVQALAELGKNDQALALISELQALDTTSVYKGLSSSFELILTEQFEAALEQTQLLKQQAPANKDVLLQLAKLQMLQRQWPEAIETYQNYIRINPKDLAIKFSLLALLMEERRFDEAEQYVDELLDINSEHGLLNRYKGTIEVTRGQFSQATGHLDKAILNGQNSPVVHLVAGFAAYQLQDYPKASSHLSQIAAQLPENHPGLRILADSLLQQGASEDAAEILDRVNGELESDADLFSKAGYQLAREGNVTDARKMAERSQELSQSAQELTRLGVLQLSLNDVEGLINLEAAAAKAPESVITQKTLLGAYLAAGQHDKAKNLALQWHQQSPQASEPMLYLARLAMVEQRYDDAKQWLTTVEKLPEAAEESLLIRARLAFLMEQDDNGVATLEKVLASSPAQINALTLLYLYKAEQGDASSVVQRANAALKINPENLALRVLVARMHFAERDDALTLQTLESVIPTPETPQAYWSLKGQALLNSGKIELAELHYRAWLDEYPLNKDAALGRLQVFERKRQYGAASAFAQTFLNKRQDWQIEALLAHFLVMDNRLDASRKVMEELPEQITQLPFVRGIQGRIYLKEQQPQRALEHIDVAYKALPSTQNILLLVEAYEAAGNPEEGFQVLQNHVENHPDDTAPLALYAQRLISRDKGQALAAYAGILERLPDDLVSLNNLAYLLYEQGEYDKAEPLARRAVAIQPSNPDAVDTLGQILVKLGQHKEALSLYQGVIKPESGSDAVYLNYVELLLAQGQSELAKRRLASRTFSHPESKQRIESLQQSYSL
ncbi:PEP-CTERM system TPR-repeat protein PrsT [Alteromonas aestuariivivens]|uniref:PEP-CTERM system TPR-repeat protein PrsT n=1 Tax=Alteromonas aestuariivivens TaxID=1938339 RepID=A0A3D8MBW4_9ALTE|nr:XrtA/PEP-CTERM system TPR-repeat protein PrsT [Alteromonas aestuariivivens]RDV27966.1 PEP-CTERM system TPR-repeat protein PrsT [Alteromonas aestuariivivens]